MLKSLFALPFLELSLAARRRRNRSGDSVFGEIRRGLEPQARKQVERVFERLNQEYERKRTADA